MTNNHSEKSRAIELEIELDVDISLVWDALTQAERLASWFPLEARADTGAGGKVFVSWGDDCAWETTIDAWNPGKHLRWLDDPWTKSDGTVVQLAVDYYLESKHGKTVVRLVNSGFGIDADWDDMYDGTRNGWIYFLRNLKHYLEHHADTVRNMAWARFQTAGTVSAAWRTLLGDTGLDIAPDPASLSEGAAVQLRVSNELIWKGVVEFANVPGTLAILIPELRDALLFIEMEAGGPTCGIWFSTYGVDTALVDSLQAQLREIADRLYPQTET